MLYGDTPEKDRLSILTQFKTTPNVNVICISSVGDTSIDLPECTVIIQVASHFGARRQEAQRLGRVLRPKAGVRIHDGYNAYFYTLVSTETREMFFANKRQRYLTDQVCGLCIHGARWCKPCLGVLIELYKCISDHVGLCVYTSHVYFMCIFVVD